MYDLRRKMSRYPKVRIVRGKISNLITRDNKIIGFKVDREGWEHPVLLDAKQMGSLFISMKENREKLNLINARFIH